MQDWLAANLELLAAKDPALAERVRTTPVGDDVQLVESKSGAPTLRFHPPDGRPFFLHSQHEPTREGQRLISNQDVSKSRLALLIGSGLGYHIVEFMKQWSRGFDVVLLIEHRLDIFRLALTCCDWRLVLAHENIQFHIGGEPHELFDYLQKDLSLLITTHPKVINHPQSVKTAPDWYNAVNEQILTATRIGKWSAQTKVTYGRLNITNILHNFALTAQCPGIERFGDTFAGVPGFIVSAGPSLDRNIDELKRVQGKGVIACVNTALRRLLSHGIEPTFVVSIDPSHMTLKHFHDYDIPASLPLLYDPELNHHVPRLFRGPKVVNWVQKNPLLKLLNERLGNRGSTRKGNTVAHSAFFVLRYLGCSPLVFVGQDLAYTREPGETHSSGSVFRGSWRWANEEKTAIIEPLIGSEEFKEQRSDIYWVPGVDGQDVPTTSQLFTYLRIFEAEVRTTEQPVIDATEGGARITGTEVKTLRETIDTYCTQDLDIPTLVQEQLAEPQDDREAVRTTLQEIRQDIRDATDASRKGLAMRDELHALLQREPFQLDTIRPAMQKFQACVRGAIDKPTKETILEMTTTAAAVDYVASRPRKDAVQDRAFFQNMLDSGCRLLDAQLGACEYVGGILDRVPTVS